MDFEITVNRECYYLPEEQFYVFVCHSGCKDMDDCEKRSMAWKKKIHPIPALKVKATFDKGQGYQEFHNFLTSLDMKIIKKPELVVTRKTDKIKKECQEKAEIAKANLQLHDIQIGKSIEKLKELGVKTEVRGIEYPENCKILTEWYEEEKIQVRPPMIKVFCHQRSTLYQLLIKCDLVPEHFMFFSQRITMDLLMEQLHQMRDSTGRLITNENSSKIENKLENQLLPFDIELEDGLHLMIAKSDFEIYRATFTHKNSDHNDTRFFRSRDKFREFLRQELKKYPNAKVL